MAQNTIVQLLLQAKDLTASGFNAVGRRLGELERGIMSLRTAARAFVAYWVQQVGAALVNAFAEQEQAVVSLNAMLRITGRYSDETTEKIQRMSSAIQALTGVSDDALLRATTTVGQLATTLSGDQLARVQRAVVGLSQAFGIDLQRAASLVGRSLAGSRDMLSRYGISLKDAHGQQAKFNLLMERTAPFFQLAVERTRSLSGSIDLLKAAYNDFQEVVGQVIAESLSLPDRNRGLTTWLRETTARLQENMGTWVHWGRVIVDIVAIVVDSVVAAIRIAYNLGAAIGDSLSVLFNGVVAITMRTINRVRNAIAHWVNEHAEALETILGMMARVAGVGFLAGNIRLRMTVNQLPADVYFDRLDEAGGRLMSRFTAMGNALGNVRERYGRLFDDLRAPILPRSAFDFGRSGGGTNLTPAGSTTDMTEAARDAQAEMQRLQQQLARNEISVAQFRDRLGELAPRMLAFRDSLSGDTLEAFDKQLEALRFTARGVGLEFDQAGVRGRTFLEELTLATTTATNRLGTLEMTLAQLTVGAIEDFGQAIMTAFDALGEGSEQAAEAFASAMLSAIADVAAGLGRFFMGKAIGALGEALLGGPKSGMALAAAAKFFAASALFYAIGGGLANASAHVGGGGGGGAGSSAASADAATGAVAGEGRGNLTVIFQGGRFLNMDDPNQYEAFRRALREINGRDANIIFS